MNNFLIILSVIVTNLLFSQENCEGLVFMLNAADQTNGEIVVDEISDSEWGELNIEIDSDGVYYSS